MLKELDAVRISEGRENRFAGNGRRVVPLDGNEIHDEFRKESLVYLPKFLRGIRPYHLSLKAAPEK